MCVNGKRTIGTYRSFSAFDSVTVGPPRGAFVAAIRRLWNDDNYPLDAGRDMRLNDDPHGEMR